MVKCLEILNFNHITITGINWPELARICSLNDLSFQNQSNISN